MQQPLGCSPRQCFVQPEIITTVHRESKHAEPLFPSLTLSCHANPIYSNKASCIQTGKECPGINKPPVTSVWPHWKRRVNTSLKRRPWRHGSFQNHCKSAGGMTEPSSQWVNHLKRQRSQDPGEESSLTFAQGQVSCSEVMRTMQKLKHKLVYVLCKHILNEKKIGKGDKWRHFALFL